jgi:molecular chaperone HscB
MQNYFSLFQLPQQFAIDLKQLETSYRGIQSASHPDRFVSAAPAERLQSMQLATTANEAYATLKTPARRACYLLSLHDINALNESNTAMSMDFLMQQMEWREALDDAKQAKNINQLEALAKLLQSEAKSLQAELIDQLDEKKDLSAATDITRKLIFIDKVITDIHQAIEQIE